MLFKGTTVKEITPAKFKVDGTLNTKDKIGFIAFVVDWCGFCKALEPGYSQASKILGDSVPFYYFDCVKYSDFAKTIGINSYPTIFLLSRDGKISKPYKGGRSSKDFIDFSCKEFRKCK